MKLILFISVVMTWANTIAQITAYTDVPYSIIAEGTDSPLQNAEVVCFNKYFNAEQLPAEFCAKYGLVDGRLFKKKVFVELFYSDTVRLGFDRFIINAITESATEIVVDYSLENADSTNDATLLSPFLVVQMPRKRRKRIRLEPV